MLHGLAHKYQPEVIHYQQLAEWSSGLRIGLSNRTGWVNPSETIVKKTKKYYFN